MPTVDETLKQAIDCHARGELQEAERLYLAILQAHPNHADAHHNLGILAVQLKQPAAGLPHLEAALQANGGQGQYWLSYAEVLFAAGRSRDAWTVLLEGIKRGLGGPRVASLLHNMRVAPWS